MDENVQDLAEVLVKPEIKKDRTVNPMAITGGRMISIEEASRFANEEEIPEMIINLIFLIANLIMAAMFTSMLYFMVKARRDGINIGITVGLLLISIGNLLYFVAQAVS